jgi:alpha-L-fucosidase
VIRLVVALCLGGVVRAASAPEPYGPVPSERQLRWHALEFYGMVHFGLNTFANMEWGSGDVSPGVFDPVDFDAGRIVRTMKAAGMKGLVLVCKHHDGFCLWPSRYTEYSVKNSPWRGGKGDMVREFADACREQGLKFGVYLSPWDRNHPDYGKPAYLVHYRNQLTELLTNYGEIFISWYDGAQGGTGYYGGARTRRVVDRRRYYQWPETWALVRKLQPQAVIFSDAGPDVRWIGNEDGAAGEPCWMALDRNSCYPGMSDYPRLTVGDRAGPDWVPPECNTSLRRAWFYHPKNDATGKDEKALEELYFKSVGRGACLDLNLSPNPKGRLTARDEATLVGFGRWLENTFSNDLARSAVAAASGVRGNDPAFGPGNAVDGRPETFWMPDDGSNDRPELVLQFTEPVAFNVVRLREHLPLGQRVESFAVDQWQEGTWREIFQGGSIGPQRLERLPKSIRTDKVRLRILRAPARPAISEIGLFQETTAAR